MPDLYVDVSTAAVRRLRAHPAFIYLVEGGLIGTDAAEGDALEDKVAQSWLFQGLDNEGRPFRDPEGSGTCVIVLKEWSEWSSTQHNTAQFPRLQMLVYADSTRKEDGSPEDRDATRKCKHVMKDLLPVFHIPGNDVHEWPGLYVFTSLRDGGRTIMEVPGTEALTVRGEQYFNNTA